MKMRKFAATAALITAAVAVTAGTANAAPGAVAPAAPVNLKYDVAKDGKTATLIAENGSVVNENGTFKIKNARGAVMAGAPLHFRVNGFEVPIAAKIDGNKATLTEQRDLQHATYKPLSNVALPFEEAAPWRTPYEREVAAFTRFKDTVGVGAAIGVATGAVIGGIAGCAVGGVVGATSTGFFAGLATWLTALVPAAVVGGIVGCGVGATAGLAFGGLIGAVLITIPVAIAAAIQYVTTINAPFVPAPSSPQRVIIVDPPKKK